MFFKPSSLTEISIGLRNNTLHLEEYINSTLKRVREADSKLHALLPEKNRKKRLLSEAEALERKYPKPSQRPPLYGVLVGVKDLFRVDGLPTRAGSKLPAQAFAGAESEVVTQLRQAGALILGKTVSTEFAYFSPGPTRNPVNTDHTPGGSSSGSATAVAAGLCPLALGTQTIGSVIRPASYCGVVGFKPSMGRMSAEGVFPFSQTIDQMGLFTQDVGSALLAASVLVKDWDATVRGVSKPSIFMPADAFLVQADYDAFNRFYELVDKLTDRGYEVINYPLFKDIKKINRIHRDLITAEFARNHKELYKQYGDLYAETSAELVKKGSRISKAALEEAKAQQRYYIAQVQEIMENEGVDVWICPSTTSEAPKGLASTGNPIMNLPWTFTGLPSITLPLSRSTHNLPLGLQVISGPGKDEQLLQYAGEFVRALSY